MKNLLIAALSLASLALPASARALGGKPGIKVKPYKREPLQNIVTWDEHSLFVHGERIMLYSGEFHPFRLPVPSLWLDVFQKIRALGYTGVSFYVDWALLEGKSGDFSAEGVFAWEPFFEAAQKAGIYLLARPGPYINAEASGGGFPGWLQRVNGILRTNATDYLHATDNYVASIGAIIAKAQITNGGPVILLQPENEYSAGTSNVLFPDAVYMEYVEKQYRDAGIVVPFISNDAWAAGHNAPGQPAAVDIYGHDSYPQGFDCANPYTWNDGALPTTWRATHLSQSPLTPYSLVEFQGGSFDPWGGLGFDKCSILVNNEFERVFYKNDFSFGVTIFNIYMTYGGTNWGNLGHPGGYTSYDYGSVITEDLAVWREKYSEAKLEANFIVGSPAYLTAIPGSLSSTLYTTSTEITATPLRNNQTQFFVIRHSQYNSLASTSYKLTINGTSAGDITIPQLSGSLSLNGRDSKIHVTDYDLGGINLLYSSAEIFTWQKYDGKTVLVVYGGPGEQHELAVSSKSKPTVKSSDKFTTKVANGTVVVNWQTTSDDRVVQIDNLYIYITERNSAYNYWVIPTPGDNNSLYTKTEASNIVLKAGYLVRTASVSRNTLKLTGDLNATTTLQVLGGAPKGLAKLTFNGENVRFKQDSTSGVVTATLTYNKPNFTPPSLTSQKWYKIDSLPEIQAGYSDKGWTAADLTVTKNSLRKLTTPTSLYASDYGYNTGTLLYRGTFKATGSETTVRFQTQGGSAYGASAWIGSDFIGSFAGFDAASSNNSTFTLPKLTAGKSYTFTLVIDNMGLDENWVIGTDTTKNPRGILDYDLAGHAQSDVVWKLTGNLGGEDYADRTRGPLNEGGLWAERQGYHLPSPPVNSQGWSASKGPTEGITAAGVAWYVTSFNLNVPKGYDVPLSFQFTNSSTTTTTTTGGSLSTPYRVQLYVNGWQFGKYVHNVGPQTKFPVPEGIWNYAGENWVAVSLWALGAEGAKVEDLQLVTGQITQTGREEVELVDSPKWKKRQSAS